MILNVKYLGDGTERLCVHWLVTDDNGPIETSEPPAQIASAKLIGKRAKIACNPNQNSLRMTRGDEVVMCLRSDEIRAVTCPKCLATEQAKVLLKHFSESVDLMASAIG